MREELVCYHCGDICLDHIAADEKNFCCNGCKQIYQLLSENNLCNYYEFSDNHGIKARGKFAGSSFAYLDDESIIDTLCLFRSPTQINIRFSLPQIHCSSCVFLLEKLHQIEPGIIQSRVNFQQKDIFISFNPSVVSLRKIVELLSFIGYEPALSLQDAGPKKNSRVNKKQIIQIGVAGFCFSNIMMLSFPEYFSGGDIEQQGLKETFSLIIFFLSIPVFFYSASEIFKSAFKGLRQKQINIDTPIALAILVTFSRSYYEIFTATGSGYLDSGTGIIFFMLIGRWFQNKTYDSLAFDRQYQSYFPLGITIHKNGEEQNIPITKLELNDTVLIRNNEMIPADAILISGNANIDYSFINGENATQEKKPGELIYAGGKQMGVSIMAKVIKPASQSYITSLWNNSLFDKNKEATSSFIHPWSRYFTAVLLSVALLASLYWYWVDSSKVLLVLTSVLIVACPCSLLLSSTFTFGNMLRIIGRHHLFLKNATVIEAMAGISHIVFDKTGTITGQEKSVINYVGVPLSSAEISLIKSATAQSSHVLSQSLSRHIRLDPAAPLQDITAFREMNGKGINASTHDMTIRLGDGLFTFSESDPIPLNSSAVHVNINEDYKGYFEIKHTYREGMEQMLGTLKKKYALHILSGDNNAETTNLEKMFGKGTAMSFSVSPQQKLDYIKALQLKGANVLMVGDGLNDAGALRQSDVGLAVSEHKANFSPACDGIIDGNAVKDLSSMLRFACMGKFNVSIGFVFSILYNIIGISLAVRGELSPVLAAILMPISSISIVAISILSSSWSARRLKWGT